MGCEDANGAAAEALRRLLVGCPSFDQSDKSLSWSLGLLDFLFVPLPWNVINFQKLNYFRSHCTNVFLLVFKDFDRCQEPKATEGPKACRWKSLGWNWSQNNTKHIFWNLGCEGSFESLQQGFGMESDLLWIFKIFGRVVFWALLAPLPPNISPSHQVNLPAEACHDQVYASLDGVRSCSWMPEVLSANL